MHKRMSLVESHDIKRLIINDSRRENLLAPSSSSWTSSSRRNSVIEDNITGATRGMQMLNFL